MRKGFSALVVALLLLASTTAGRAQSLEDYDYENLQLRGLGAEVGWVIPSKLKPTQSLGIRADMGFVGPYVRIAPSMRFWSSSLRESELERLSDQILLLCEKQATDCPTLNLGEVRRSDLELSLDAHVVPAADAPFSVYGGAGLSLHLLNGRGELIDGTFVEDLLDTVAPGLNLVAGAGIPIRPLQVLTEARAIITSDVQYLNFTLGIAWTLPRPPARE